MHTEAGRVTRRCRDETLEDGRVSRSQSAEETSGAPAFRLTHGSLRSNPLCFRLLIQERNLTSRTCNRVTFAASSLTIPPSLASDVHMHGTTVKSPGDTGIILSSRRSLSSDQRQ